MTSTAIVTVLCPDKTGLVSGITAMLWDLGVNLIDTNFSVLGGGADFSAVCEVPEGLSMAELQNSLGALPVLSGADIVVKEYAFEPYRGPDGDVTHEITVSGGDQPGLVARFCETFVEFGANIVTLNAGPQPDNADRYEIRLAVSVPGNVADACMATVKNTAEAIALSCDIRQV
ncbi:MAG: glycine cleavage system protein R [Alphaproteobacteria bacterium]